jgi:hypothetical protein
MGGMGPTRRAKKATVDRGNGLGGEGDAIARDGPTLQNILND